MSDFEIRANQPLAQGAGFKPDEPESDDEKPKKQSETNVSIHAEGLSKNGIKGAAVRWQAGKTFKGNVFDKTITGNVELGNFAGTGAEFKLSKNLNDDFSIYGAMGFQGRVSLNDSNIANNTSEAYAYEAITSDNDIVYPEPQTMENNKPNINTHLRTKVVKDGNTYHASAAARANAEMTTVKNDFNLEMRTGVRYENEKETFDLSVGAGLNAQVLPYAQTSASAGINKINDENGNLMEVVPYAYTYADFGNKVVFSPYLSGELAASIKFGNYLEVGPKVGIQVYPKTGEVRPEFGGTIKLNVSGLVNDTKKKN